MFRAKRRVIQRLAYRPPLGAKQIDSLAIFAPFEVHMTLAHVAFDAVRISPNSGSFNSGNGH